MMCWNCTAKEGENGSLRKITVEGREFSLCGVCSSAYAGNPMFHSSLLRLMKEDVRRWKASV